MLQYLLNATAIWLISLVMFDVFLRRESYHSYNRFYLLFTFLLGALLPLAHWQDNSRLFSTTIEKPLKQVIAVKQNIITATTHSADTFNWQLWLTVIYLSGVFVAILLLVIDIIKLSASYHAITRLFHDGWDIIETGKEHAPFSFLNSLFVCSRQRYNNEEWSMILAHEKRHTSLYHVADLLLMQLARIIFWFHQIIYLYNKRLLLVHEYQADNTAPQQTQVYGRFLIEQAVLQSAPALSHSFNRSPIKNRILMLTRRSSTAAKTKMLVFIPLLLLCLFCFSKNIFSQKKEGKHPPMVKLALPDNSHWGNQTLTSYDPILANPHLICSLQDAEVTSFSFSMQPRGKDYIGPYTCTGSSLNEKMLEKLRKVKESDTGKTKIYIEDIHVNYKGKDSAMGSVIYTVVPPSLH